MDGSILPKGQFSPGLGLGSGITKKRKKKLNNLFEHDIGAVESGWLFSLGVNPAFQRCNRMLAEHGGALTAIIDDNYISGPPAQAFEPNRRLTEDLKEVGLELQPAKSNCHINAAHRDGKWD